MYNSRGTTELFLLPDRRPGLRPRFARPFRGCDFQGFNSRSEFLRYAARDAVKHPEFSREGWKQIAASEHDLRSGEAELVSREEVVEMMDRDEDDE